MEGVWSQGRYGSGKRCGPRGMVPGGLYPGGYSPRWGMVQVGMVGGGGPGRCDPTAVESQSGRRHYPPCGQNDTRLWKHYLLATSLTGGNNLVSLCTISNQLLISSNLYIYQEYRNTYLTAPIQCALKPDIYKFVHEMRSLYLWNVTRKEVNRWILFLDSLML